jgi:signal transduction histidine kinase
VWLSVLATALVAVAFQPARDRLRRLVNRLVYGERATPYEVLSDFAAQMTGRYTTGELLPRIARTVSECLGGARVAVWLRTGDELVPEAAWPLSAAEPPPGVTVTGEELPVLPADHVCPVRHGSELLGALAVDVTGREPLAPGELGLLDHVASQAGLVLRNVRLVEELHSSRQRLVNTADDQRRRLERNLHDGAQQSLVSVALMLRMAANQHDPEVLSATLHEAADQLQRAIAELRELARGIHPAVLTDRGLAPALTSLAERCPVPVELRDELRRRLPAPVEGTLYFVVAEALTNVAKYSGARLVQVRLADLGTAVLLEVADDGVGGADRSRGSGLVGLADRVAVHDGELTVSSPAGQGTRITCRLPVPAPAPDDPTTPARQPEAVAG